MRQFVEAVPLRQVCCGKDCGTSLLQLASIEKLCTECLALQEFKDLGKQYVQDMRAKVPPSRSNATHVVDKMLRNSWNVGYISMLLPQACIIQVLHLGPATKRHAMPHDPALRGMIVRLECFCAVLCCWCETAGRLLKALWHSHLAASDIDIQMRSNTSLVPAQTSTIPWDKATLGRRDRESNAQTHISSC